MLTNPTRYGLIACRYLVWGWHNGLWLTAPDIAERYGMNVRALSPALQQLVRAGVLRSRRGGTRPGFLLSRAPEKITMLEVMRALEGEYHIDCCRSVLPGIRCSCCSSDCRICGLFRDMLDDLRSRLSSLSLEDHASTEDFSGGILQGSASFARMTSN